MNQTRSMYQNIWRFYSLFRLDLLKQPLLNLRLAEVGEVLVFHLVTCSGLCAEVGKDMKRPCRMRIWVEFVFALSLSDDLFGHVVTAKRLLYRETPRISL